MAFELLEESTLIQFSNTSVDNHDKSAINGLEQLGIPQNQITMNSGGGIMGFTAQDLSLEEVTQVIGDILEKEIEETNGLTLLQIQFRKKTMKTTSKELQLQQYNRNQ